VDEQGQVSRRRIFLADASAGLLSGLLYLSYILSFAFLVPVQQALYSRGMKAGLVSSLAAVLVILIGTVARMVQLKAFALSSLLPGLLPPMLLLAALVWLNAKTPRLSRIARLLLAVLGLSLIATPFLLRMGKDQTFLAQLYAYVEAMIESAGILEESPAMATELVNRSLRILGSGFSAFILLTLAASWYVGSIVAYKGRNLITQAIDKPAQLSAFRTPSVVLWPGLAVWTLLFIMLITKTQGLVSLIVWNLSLCAAALYGLQGLGVVSHLLQKPSVPGIFRLLVPLVAVTALFNTATSAVILIALPLLGITEVWIPYRSLKGAST